MNIDCRCHVSRLSTTCTSFDFELFDSTNYPALRFAAYLGPREKNISKWIWIKPSTNYWKHTASLMDRWRIIRLSGHLQFNHRTRSQRRQKDKLGVGKNTMVTNKGLRVSPKLSKRMKAVSCSNYLTLEGETGTKNYKQIVVLPRTSSNKSMKLMKPSGRAS